MVKEMKRVTDYKIARNDHGKCKKNRGRKISQKTVLRKRKNT